MPQNQVIFFVANIYSTLSFVALGPSPPPPTRIATEAASRLESRTRPRIFARTKNKICSSSFRSDCRQRFRLQNFALKTIQMLIAKITKAIHARRRQATSFWQTQFTKSIGATNNSKYLGCLDSRVVSHSTQNIGMLCSRGRVCASVRTKKLSIYLHSKLSYEDEVKKGNLIIICKLVLFMKVSWKITKMEIKHFVKKQ